MMYVIYNSDGSIKSKFLNEFVMQGSAYENVLFVAFDGRSADTYTLYAEFKLPNGSTTTVSSGSTPQTKNIDGNNYTGKCISLSNAETLVAGALQMNIKVLTNDTNKILVSFNTYITVNETGLQPNDPVIITAQEYQNLLSMIGNQVANYQTILKGISLASFGNLEDYQVGQALYVVNSSEAKLYEIDSNYTAHLVVDLLDKYSKAEIDSMMSGKLNKSSYTNTVYAVDSFGTQVNIDYDSAVRGNTFALRDGNGHVRTETPTGDYDATTKKYVDEQINTYAAYYITKNAQGDAFATRAELMAATTFYSGGVVRVPTRNDYCYVLADEQHDNGTTKYIYNNGWEFQIVVNETSFTQAQLDAINSGATTAKINSIADKVEKMTVSDSSLKAYLASSGGDTSKVVTNTANIDTIPLRDSQANIRVGTAQNLDDATSKQYVDTALALKFDKSSIKSSSGGETTSNVYSAYYVKGQLDDIREIASGKTNNFKTSLNYTVALIQDFINNGGKCYFWYANNWKVCDNVSYYDDFRTGKSLGSTSVLNSRALDCDITDILVTSTSYYPFIDAKGNMYLVTDADYDKLFKSGDNIFILETDCADRWFDGTTHLYALETAKLGYHALGTSSDPMPFISTQTVTGTTPSISLYSLDSVRCSSALTSLTITSLVTSTNDDNPTWQIQFVADTGFTITLPVGCTWKYGTPTFNVGEEYTIIIEKRINNDYYAYLL